MFKRAQFEELFLRIMEPRDKIQVISGPRQVGKSTLVKQVLQEMTVPHLLVSADNVQGYHVRSEKIAPLSLSSLRLSPSAPNFQALPRAFR